jgi:hypothetical protein
MRLAISIILAYLVTGAAQVIKDITSSPMDRPAWARRPTFGVAMLLMLTWCIRTFAENTTHTRGHVDARGIAFGFATIIVQVGLLAAFIWCCIAFATYLFGNAVLQIIVSAVFIVVGSLIAIPLLNLLAVPVAIIVALPLEVAFPLKKEKSASQEEKWCKTCKHYRKSREYENIMRGLWRSAVLPQSDKLPCSIVSGTSGVWKRHFESEQKTRSLFPKGCSFFERKV